MKLPIRNRTDQPLTLFIEPYCHEHEVPPEGEAIVTLEDGRPHVLDVYGDNWISLWDEGQIDAVVEVVSKEQNVVAEALVSARGCLHQFGPQGKAAMADLEEAIDREEAASGHIGARFAAYAAFRDGFRMKQSEAEPEDAALPPWSGRETLEGAYRAGGVAAFFNHRVRLEPSLIELGKPPFDSDGGRGIFEEADAMVAAQHRA